LSWLEGLWKREATNKNQFEIWERSESKLSGKGFQLNLKDTIYQEQMG